MLTRLLAKRQDRQRAVIGLITAVAVLFGAALSASVVPTFRQWIPLLGGTLVCLTTLALDPVNYGGAITVATDPSQFDQDPFARIFPGTVVETDLFCPVAPPAGPVVERYSGVAWPSGRFDRV